MLKRWVDIIDRQRVAPLPILWYNGGRKRKMREIKMDKEKELPKRRRGRGVEDVAPYEATFGGIAICFDVQTVLQ